MAVWGRSTSGSRLLALNQAVGFVHVHFDTKRHRWGVKYLPTVSNSFYDISSWPEAFQPCFGLLNIAVPSLLISLIIL